VLLSVDVIGQTLHYWDLSKKNIVETTEISDSYVTAVYPSNGLLGLEDGTVWAPGKGVFQTGKSAVTALSLDGSRLITGHSNGTVYIWQGGQCVRALDTKIRQPVCYCSLHKDRLLVHLDEGGWRGRKAIFKLDEK